MLVARFPHVILPEISLKFKGIAGHVGKQKGNKMRPNNAPSNETIVDEAYRGGLSVVGEVMDTMAEMVLGSKSEPSEAERIATALETIARNR